MEENHFIWSKFLFLISLLFVPLFNSLLQNHISFYPSFFFINFTNVFGFVLFIVFSLQFPSGVLLSRFYRPHYVIASDTIHWTVNEVYYAPSYRFIHLIGASLFMFFPFIHLFRGFYLLRLNNWFISLSFLHFKLFLYLEKDFKVIVEYNNINVFYDHDP